MADVFSRSQLGRASCGSTEVGEVPFGFRSPLLVGLMSWRTQPHARRTRKGSTRLHSSNPQAGAAAVFCGRSAPAGRGMNGDARHRARPVEVSDSVHPRRNMHVQQSSRLLDCICTCNNMNRRTQTTLHSYSETSRLVRVHIHHEGMYGTTFPQHVYCENSQVVFSCVHPFVSLCHGVDAMGVPWCVYAQLRGATCPRRVFSRALTCSARPCGRQDLEINLVGDFEGAGQLKMASIEGGLSTGKHYELARGRGAHSHSRAVS